MAITLTSQGSNLIVARNGVSKSYPKGDVVTLLNDPFLTLFYNNETVFQISSVVEIDNIAATDMTDLQSKIVDLLDTTEMVEGGTGPENDPVFRSSPAFAISNTNINDWNGAAVNSHTHDNKDLLDQIDPNALDSWNGAAQNSHSHLNKPVLDGITSTKTGNWDLAFTNQHTHANKTTLDTITSGKVTNWDAAFGWGNHSLAGYAPNVLSGYLSGAGTVAATDTVLQAIQKINGNVTALSSAGYLTSASAAGTYQTLANLSTDLTASATKYPSVNAVINALSAYLTTSSASGSYQTLANLSTDMTASATKYPSVNAVNTALSAYLTSASASSTYQTINNLSADLTASASKYPSVNAVNTGLSGKANNILTGYTVGAGTVAATDSVQQAIQKLDGNIALKANAANAALTGVPTAPTAAANTNTTQIATTAYVIAALAGTSAPTNYITTDSSQTGLTGDKSTSGIWTFSAAPTFAGANVSATVLPTVSATIDLGSTSLRFNNIYGTNHLSGGSYNMGTTTTTNNITVRQGTTSQLVAGYFGTSGKAFFQAAGTIPTDLGSDKQVQIYGSIALPTVSSGIYFTAPNGTVYKLTASNAGAPVLTAQ
ncbi:hypothetical protein [Dyadobacter sandarakinus]|uniref:Tail fiber protein n=1 Tax=Dyadobacter sandarakinus TaxID=2747268 RepID=A0ABX7I2F1_9BACT|nr:hypothetical protein [Dyadobacter sandarakinus]QRQ99696.1 hypothetical protein HWI92_01590 [Dyadobacter sandarakinus]